MNSDLVSESPPQRLSELDQARRDLSLEQRRAGLFADRVIPIGLALLRETELGRLLEMILREARGLSNADGATLYMRRGDTLEFFMALNVSLRLEMGGHTGKPVSFRPLLLHQVEDGAPNLSNAACFTVHHRTSLNLPDIRHSDKFDFSGPRRFDEANNYRTQSLLTVPLIKADGTVAAVLQLINAIDPEKGNCTPFAEATQHIVESLAALAAGALESFEIRQQLYEQQQKYLHELEETQARLQEELAQAEKYVRSILPAPLEAPFRVDWLLESSSELGGDSFGYHEIGDGRWAFYILDVCGHGVAAALLSVTAVKVLRSGALPTVDYADPGAVLTVMNNLFLMKNQNNFYFTIWYGVFDPRTRELAYASAGHAPALLCWPQEKKAVKLEVRGMVLGGRENKVYPTHRTTLDLGAVLYLVSDGTYEIKRPEGDMWPYESFLELMAALPTGTELACLHETIRQIRAPEPLEDDFTIVRLQT